MKPRTNKSPIKRKKNTSPKNIRSTEASDDETAFQSPDRENETDYGLEFTTSRLAELNTSPRRCSTLRKNGSKEHHTHISTGDETSDTENQQPDSTPLRPTLQKELEKQTQKDNQQLRAPPRRKQNKPQNRIKKLHREIERLQKSEGFMIPRLPFSRLVREIVMEHTISPFMITVGALEAIQTATEMYLTQRFQDAYLLTQYRSRVTLEVRDMALVAYFCKTYGNL